MSAVTRETIIQAAHDEVGGGLSGPLLVLLAAGAGLSAATLYVAQPMLSQLARSFGVSDAAIGAVPTLTQVGYALGIFFFAPLGDRVDRRRLIVLKAGLLTAALLLCGLSQTPGVFWGASLAVGLTATMAQDIVPAAAALAPPASRGRAVGAVMTGLLTGILLSRVVSGGVASLLGWRAVYLGAAGCVALVGAVAARRLPRFVPDSRLGYGALVGSLLGLWRAHPGLRRAATAQALLSMAFSGFWSTLAVMLYRDFGLGSATAGAFGLAGAAGALAAPLAGRLADRRGPGLVTRLGAALAALCFALLFFDGGLSRGGRLALLGVSTVGFDFGIQASLVAHQTLVYSLDPAARSRLNALLVSAMFLGMASGGAAATAALARYGWRGVVAFAVLTASASLAVRLATPDAG